MVNELTEEFLEEFVKCCLSKKSFFESVKSYMKSNYFPSEELQKVWNEIVRQYTRERRLPTIGNLTVGLKKDFKCLKLLGRIKRIKLPNYDDTMTAFEEFIKQSKFIEFHDRLADVYNESEDKTKAYNMFTEMATELSNLSFKTVSYDRVFKDFNKRHFDRVVDTALHKKERIFYGIDPLDDLTGGMEKGETTLFLGDSGVGKSQLLIHCGISAARGGSKVAHVQAEGTRKQCVDRYDAAWTGMLYKDIKTGLSPDEKRNKDIRKTLAGIGSGEIFIESFEQFNSKTVVDVRNIVINLIKTYGNIDVLILDYLELIDPGDGRKYSPSEERFRQQAIGRALKNIAVEFNIVVITATQSSAINEEQRDNPDFKITRYNLSEDRGKLRPFDNFITINQTKDERKAKMMRLYCDKFREHDSGQTISICNDLSRCRFYDRKRTMEMLNED